MPRDQRETVAFIGIDLAWQSDKNPSGFAVAIGDETEARLSFVDGLVHGLHNVKQHVQDHLRDRTVVAIDAPLIVVNTVGQRRCEGLIGAEYGARGASAHSTNLTRYPNSRSVELARFLQGLGFEHPSPRFEDFGDANRLMLEVYPHPAMIELFQLPSRLRYKKGPVTHRRKGLAELSALLAGRLPQATPALHDVERFTKNTFQLKGRGLKEYEDSLDAVLCTYLALHFWSTRARGNRLFGDLDTGYIVVPCQGLQHAT